MTAANELVFLLEVDNTLLDNDRVQDELRAHLASEFGPASRDRYWESFEALRAGLGYADYLGALQRYRLGAMNDPRLLQMSAFLVDYPFPDRLYLGALAVIEHLRRWGATVILSDGDVVFQPRNPAFRAVGRRRRPGVDLHPPRTNAGRSRAALPGPSLRHGGRQAAHSGGDEEAPGGPAYDRFPAPWGYYALDPHNLLTYPPADLAIERIGDLRNFNLSMLVGPARIRDRGQEAT